MPVTNNFTHASHPLNIVRSICQPGDFIVVKLDIDVIPLEAAIMTEIERSSKLRNCIAEINYEQHYNHPGAPSTRLLIWLLACKVLYIPFATHLCAGVRKVACGWLQWQLMSIAIFNTNAFCLCSNIARFAVQMSTHGLGTLEREIP